VSHFLGRAELLDQHGGTDVVQVPSNMISFDCGLEHIVAVRLSAKGMHRWYANCCRTPLGNTIEPSVPFIGMQVEVFRTADTFPVDMVFGRPRSYVMGKFSIGHVPQASAGFPLSGTVGVISKVLGWKLSGKSWPHPYSDQRSRTPKFPVTILQPSEREALRAKCGPHPTA
jgi:hypothetical protein